MAIQFIGRSRPGQGDKAPRWIKHLPPSHGVSASHRPAGSDWDPTFDEGFKITLASGFSDFEYLYPFYFGRSGDKVLVMMFEKAHDGGEMRFAQSPSGGGDGNPAWRQFLPGDVREAPIPDTTALGVADISRGDVFWQVYAVTIPGFDFVTFSYAYLNDRYWEKSAVDFFTAQAN